MTDLPTPDPTEPPAARIPPRIVRTNAWPAWGAAAILGLGGLILWLAVAPRVDPVWRLFLLLLPLVAAALCTVAARATLTLDDAGVTLRGLGERHRGWDELLAWEAIEHHGQRSAALVSRDGSRFILPSRYFTGDQAAVLRFGLVRRLGAPVRDGWVREAEVVESPE